MCSHSQMSHVTCINTQRMLMLYVFYKCSCVTATDNLTSATEVIPDMTTAASSSTTSGSKAGIQNTVAGIKSYVVFIVGYTNSWCDSVILIIMWRIMESYMLQTALILWCLKKLKAHIALKGTPMTELRTSLAVWNHTVLPATRHKWTRPALTAPRRRLLDFLTPEEWTAETI